MMMMEFLITLVKFYMKFLQELDNKKSIIYQLVCLLHGLDH